MIEFRGQVIDYRVDLVKLENFNLINHHFCSCTHNMRLSYLKEDGRLIITFSGLHYNPFSPPNEKHYYGMFTITGVYTISYAQSITVA